MQDIVAITKALSHENRVRALMMLRHDELCVCQIIEMLCFVPASLLCSGPDPPLAWRFMACWPKGQLQRIMPLDFICW
ncbi:MAG: hypothetical protein IIA65_10240 [Planctomycetes bacterium]|nr:hypothetical protein [Planctomycetota bacterium]